MAADAKRVADAEAHRLQEIERREEEERRVKLAAQQEQRRKADTLQREEAAKAQEELEARIRAQEEQKLKELIALATARAEAEVAPDIWRDMPDRARRTVVEAQLRLLDWEKEERIRRQAASTASELARLQFRADLPRGPLEATR